MNMVFVTASEATRSATSPLPTIRAFRKVTARSSWTVASRGDTTERSGRRSRIRAATASGSSPFAQKTAAAVAIGSRFAPGTITSRRRSGSLSIRSRSADGNDMKTKLSGPVSVGSRTPTTRKGRPRSVIGSPTAAR